MTLFNIYILISTAFFITFFWAVNRTQDKRLSHLPPAHILLACFLGGILWPMVVFVAPTVIGKMIKEAGGIRNLIKKHKNNAKNKL
jgi:uncharacterized membrane protein